MNSKWKTLKTEADLKKLPRNNRDRIMMSANILVSSTKKRSENEVYLMYFDYCDNCFHFPNYAPDWSDIRLKPIEEINVWMRLPKKPKLSLKN